MSGESGAAAARARIAVTLPARDFSRDWRRYNLVANYIAEYASAFFDHKDRAENVISSVFYELLEHMATISGEGADIDMRLLIADGRLVFEIATTSVSPESLAPHQALVARLHGEELGVLYRGMLEAEPGPGVRRGELGLAMLAHDYRADISTLAGAAGDVSLRATIDQGEINP